MGTHPNGILAYGYDLGGGDPGWKLEGIEEYQSLVTPWYDGKDPDKKYFADQVIATLLIKQIGFVEAYEDGLKGYFDRHRAAVARLRVQVVRYGSYDYSGYIIATQAYQAPDYGAMPIDIEFSNSAASGDLDAALQVLGLTPTQTEPKWTLGSFYG